MMKRFTPTQLGVFRPLLMALFVLPSADTVLACSIEADTNPFYSIEEVTVLPAGEITSNDPVTLEVFIVTPHHPAYVYQPTEVVVTGTDITVDIFVDSGPLTALSSITVTVDLGTFQPGTYEYAIYSYPEESDWKGKAVGSLSVVQGPPIPTVSTWGLTVMALLVLTTGTLMSRRKPAA